MSKEIELSKSRILIVDDSRVNVALLEQVLIKHGFDNLISLTDSREVEKTLQNIEVDLILLDIRMPHLDGFEILELINRLYGDDHLPVLVLTAQTDVETRDKALSLGATDFLLKPFDAIEVILRVKNMLNLKRRFQDERDVKHAFSQLVQLQSEELSDLLLEVVHRLGRAAEYRDNETGLHIIRMSKYSRLIAEEMGVDKKKAEFIEYASTMHDIGKIAIPDSVLLKPGKLDDSEWEIMRKHTTTGADILSDSQYPLLQSAANIAHSHHEKYDGSGYPQGLEGESIPVEARIVAVADVFDALTSKRPYKEPWSVEEAVELIQQGRGNHFDPAVVDAFIKVLPDFLEIKQKFSDTDQTSS